MVEPKKIVGASKNVNTFDVRMCLKNSQYWARLTKKKRLFVRKFHGRGIGLTDAYLKVYWMQNWKPKWDGCPAPSHFGFHLGVNYASVLASCGMGRDNYASKKQPILSRARFKPYSFGQV